LAAVKASPSTTGSPHSNNPLVRKAIDLPINRTEFKQAGYPLSLMTTLDSPGTPFFDPSIAESKTNLAEVQTLIDQVVARTVTHFSSSSLPRTILTLYRSMKK
jgi:hypothetical protein